MHVAAYINHSFGPKRQQLVYKILVAPFPWRIDDKCRVFWGELGDSGKDVRGISCAKGTFIFGDVIKPGISRSKLDGIRR
jgi:hypothetical protein